MNNIILQGAFGYTDHHSKVSSPKKKRSRRSFIPNTGPADKNYCHKKREGPPVLSFPENEMSEFILDDSNKRQFLWSLMRYKTTEQKIPCWIDFRILISNNIPVLKTNVGYLDCIDSSAAEMSTIYQVCAY